MRILIVSQYFWPETFGITALVNRLTRHGDAVTVLTGQPNYPDGSVFPGYSAWRICRESHGHAAIIRVPLVPRGRRSRLRLALNYLSFIISASFFAPWLLRSQQFDIVFVYAPSPLLQVLPAILLARIGKAPLVVWVQDLWPESLSATGYIYNRAILGAVKAVVRFIYRCSDAILIQSRAFREPVEALTDRPEKIRYYPNSVELAGAAEPSAQAVALAERLRSGFSVLFTGNLGTAQALEVVIDAAERLQQYPDVCFYLVGSGSQDAWLAGEVDRRGIKNVVLPGRFPATDMPAIMAAAAALLVTLKREEIFAYTVPSKVQAYLAAGRPVLAALDGEGARLVGEAGAGLTCGAEDVAGLVDAVLRLRAMPVAEREAMGQAGQAYFAGHFESGKLTKRLLEIFAAVRRRGDKR